MLKIFKKTLELSRVYQPYNRAAARFSTEQKKSEQEETKEKNEENVEKEKKQEGQQETAKKPLNFDAQSKHTSEGSTGGSSFFIFLTGLGLIGAGGYQLYNYMYKDEQGDLDHIAYAATHQAEREDFGLGKIEAEVQLHRLIRQNGRNSAAVANFMRELGKKLQSYKMTEKSLLMLQKAIDTYVIAKGESCSEIAQTLSDLAYVQTLQGEFENAIKSLNRASAINKQNKDHQEYFNCLENIIFMTAETFDDANQQFIKLIEQRQYSLGANDPGLARCYLRLSLIAKKFNNQQAQNTLIEKFQSLKQYSVENPSLYIDTLHNLANYYKIDRKYDLAIKTLQESLDTIKNNSKYQNQEAKIPTIIKNIGLAYDMKGEKAQALDFLQQSIDSAKKVPNQDGFIFDALGYLASIYEEEKQNEKAIGVYQQLSTQSQSIRNKKMEVTCETKICLNKEMISKGPEVTRCFLKAQQLAIKNLGPSSQMATELDKIINSTKLSVTREP